MNDAPALKYADIGIAMGKRGSEVSREAADLVLLDDNFSTIVQTIRDGRRIYDNIRKAVGYIFTIHIPIALISLLAPLLGIAPEYSDAAAFACGAFGADDRSDLLHRTGAPAGRRRISCERPPRKPDEKLLNIRKTGGRRASRRAQPCSLRHSAHIFCLFALRPAANAALARTMGISIMLICNVLLVLGEQLGQRICLPVGPLKLWRKDRVMWAVMLGTLAVLLLIVYSPLSTVF